MMINHLIQLFIWCVIGGFIFCVIAFITKSRIDISKILFFSYLTGVLSQTVFPTLFYDKINGNLKITFGTAGSHINLIPFYSLYHQLQGDFNVNESDVISTIVVNVLGNILLFLPLGFLAPYAIKNMDHVKKIFLSGLVLSCLIEIIQLIEGRSCDVDDVILNVLGIVLGFGVFKVFHRFQNSLHKNT